MPIHPAARSAIAGVICDSAPIIASAMADFPHATQKVQFGYSASGVRVTAAYPDLLERAFELLHPAFTAAGWGLTCQFKDGWVREAVTFQPPHLQTQCGQPTDFPPR